MPCGCVSEGNCTGSFAGRMLLIVPKNEPEREIDRAGPVSFLTGIVRCNESVEGGAEGDRRTRGRQLFLRLACLHCESGGRVSYAEHGTAWGSGACEKTACTCSSSWEIFIRISCHVSSRSRKNIALSRIAYVRIQSM